MALDWGGERYPAYRAELKVSSEQKAAYNSQVAMTNASMGMMNTYMGMMQTQFAQQQNLLNNVLIPQYQEWVNNPSGLGLEAMAAMKSQAMQTVGGQLASQQQQLRQKFATQNLGGLQSGVQQALGAQLGMAGAGQVANLYQQIAMEDANRKWQQQQLGMQGLGQAAAAFGSSAAQMGGLGGQMAGLAQQGIGNQMQMANQMQQAGSFWGNLGTGLVGSLATTGLGMMTGGLSNLFTGGTRGGGYSGQGYNYGGFAPGMYQSAYGGLMGLNL